MIKIAITGKVNSGKNTIASLIQSNSNLDFVCCSFADNLKKIAKLMYPQIEDNWLWGPSELRQSKIPGLDLTVRQLLLDLGKFGRRYSSSTWINSLVNRDFEEKSIIITDLRFINELEAIKDDYFIIKVIKPNNNITIDDISEKEIDLFNPKYINKLIVNDRGLKELEEKVKALVNAHFQV